MIRAAGAAPVLYATWAYEKESPALAKMGISYDEMAEGMYAAYHEAARENGALIADVGRAFYERAEREALYAGDGCHPNAAGSRLAAEMLAEVMMKDWAGKHDGK